jgi:hypothetical protein
MKVFIRSISPRADQLSPYRTTVSQKQLDMVSLSTIVKISKVDEGKLYDFLAQYPVKIDEKKKQILP